MLKTEELIENLIKEKEYDKRIIPFIKAFFLYNEEHKFWDRETITRKIELYKQKVDRLELANLGEKTAVFDETSKTFVLNEELFENRENSNLFESISQVFEEQELIVKDKIDADIKTGLYSIERMKYDTNRKDKESILRMISSAFNTDPKKFYDIRNNIKKERASIQNDKIEEEYIEACTKMFLPGIANEVSKIFNSSEDYQKKESYIKIYAISLQTLRYRIENPKEDKAVIKQQYNQLKNEFYSKTDDYAITIQDLEKCEIDSTWTIPIDKIDSMLSEELQEVQAKKSIDVKIDDFVSNMKKEENLSEIEMALNTTSQSVSQEYLEKKAEILKNRYGKRFGPIAREYLKRSCKAYGWNKDELDKKVNNYLRNLKEIQFKKKLEGASISTAARYIYGEKIEVKNDLLFVNPEVALGIFFHEQEHVTDVTERSNHKFESGLKNRLTNEYATEIGAVHLIGNKMYDDKLCFTHSMEGYNEFKYVGSMLSAALGISEFELAKLRDKGERKFSSYMKEKYSYMDIEGELEKFESILYQIDSAPSIINMKQMSEAYADAYNMAIRIIKARLEYEREKTPTENFELKSKYEMTKIAVNMNLAKRKLHLKKKYTEPIIKDDTILKKYSKVDFKDRKDYLSLVEELYPEKKLQFDNKKILRHVSREFKHPIVKKISNIFKRNDTPMLNAPQEQPSWDNNERKGFQKGLRNGQEEPLTISVDENMLGEENNQLIIDKSVEEKGNEAK